MTHHLIPIAQLKSDDIAKMLQLMEEYYDHLNPDKFIHDLREKEGVLLIYDDHEQICGFSTYLLMTLDFKGEEMKVLYSGDTVIQKRFWGQMKTAKMFMTLIGECLSRSNGRLFWFLLSKGIRTYRLLPLYFHKYYPSPNFETPAEDQELLARLAIKKFGGAYRIEEGVVRHEPPSDRLKEKFLSLGEHKLEDPHVKFFLKKNAGYIQGDDLCCLAEISAENLTSIGQRWLNLELQHR